MQNCYGFAEAALRHYLIKATEQGSRAATSQLKWLLSGRPPSLFDNAHPPPTTDGAAAGEDAPRLKNAASASAPTAAENQFDKSGSRPYVGCLWSGPEKHGTGPQATY